MRTSSIAFSISLAFALAAAGTAAWAAERRGTAKPEPAEAPRAALVELGRRLFFEPAASRTGRVSCASCHDPDHGFTGRAHPSIDEFGPMHRRAMPLTDLADGPMHSDGEFEDVRELLEARLLPFDELPLERRVNTLLTFGLPLDRYGNLTGPRPALLSVGDRVAADGYYADGFLAAFGEPKPTTERVMIALEAYARSLHSGRNAYDRYLAGDETALSPAAARGLVLFTGRAGCVTCHVTEPLAAGPARLRDGRFHDTGIAWRSARRADPRDPKDVVDPGLAAHGERAADRRAGRMKFKTPSLRDVARRGPYMHDGSLGTLAEVVDYYDRGGARHPGLDAALRPLRLTDAEKDDLVAFLFALSSEERAGLGAPPPWLGRPTTVRIVRPDGSPVAGTELTIEPSGDGFLGTDVPAAPARVCTDADGRATIAFPPTTHARILVTRHGIAGGRPLPDLAGGAELIAVPEDRLALRVITDGDGFPDTIEASPLAVTDALQRIAIPREGEAIVFTLARRLSKREGVYVARVPKRAAGSVRRALVPRGRSGSARTAQADLDFAGGTVTTVDLRPVGTTALTAPEMPPGGLQAR